MRWLIIALCAFAAFAVFSYAATAYAVTGNVIASEANSNFQGSLLSEQPSEGSFVLEERVEISRVSSFGDVRFEPAH